jgi:peptidoglycan/xylan/chitin deacetylase (PgdA/CDA1 family)
MLKRFMGCLFLIVLLIQMNRSSIHKVALKDSEKPLYQCSALTFLVKPARRVPENKANRKIMTTLEPVPVLYYHSIMKEVNNEVRMPPDQFEKQLAYLAENGFHCITLHQLYESLYQGSALPPKPFVITFDDGYIDNYQTAFPILKNYGFVASVFMVSGYIDEKGYLTWSQLKELSSNGWDIADHTVHHLDLLKSDNSDLTKELEDSKQTLEIGLGHSVDFFAYPYGDFNDTVIQAVKNAGYLMAFTTLRGWADTKTDAYHIHRVYCYANMGLKEFANRLENPNY